MSAIYNELEFAIKHLPPAIPEEIISKINSRFESLKSLKGAATEAEVQDAMIDIGFLEWPYRQAYHEMMMACCSKTQHEMLLESLSDKTRKKFIGIGGNDASVAEVVHSKLFEEKLTPEERYEIQESALNARLKMGDFMADQIKQRPHEWEKRLGEALELQKQIDAKITDLQGLSEVDDDWKPEIIGRVAQMRLGWSIAEPDVTLDQVTKEIEYWKGTFASGDDMDTLLEG